MYPNNTRFPVLLGPSPTLLTSPQKRRKMTTTTTTKKERTNISKIICVAHIFSGAWSNSQWCEGFLSAFASCSALECTLLGKIPVPFGCVARGLWVCAAGLCWKGAQSSLSPPFPSLDFPVVCLEWGFSWPGSFCGGLFKANRAAKSSLGILVWCAFSHFLAATRKGWNSGFFPVWQEHTGLWVFKIGPLLIPKSLRSQRRASPALRWKLAMFSISVIRLLSERMGDVNRCRIPFILRKLFEVCPKNPPSDSGVLEMLGV